MCRKEEGEGTTVLQATVSGSDYGANVLAPEDEWISKVKHDEFKEDVKNLGKQLAEAQGPDDVAHLKKIMLWTRACSVVGMATCWYAINPVSIYLLSLGIMVRWTCIGHHVCHGGFDKCSKGEYSRFKFGVGSLYRRCVDWLDWMLVEAWNVEHNQMHHYCLGELADPDLVENNFTTFRGMKLNWVAKKIVVFFMALTWKFYYYAPNTFKQLKIHELRRQGKVPTLKSGKAVSEGMMQAPWPIAVEWFYKKNGPIFFSNMEFFARVLGPYFVRQFVLLPIVAGLAFGPTARYNMLISMLLAEGLTNLHSFLVIVTNHAGDDLYRFERHCEARSATYYLRQIISSVNFTTGKPYTFLGDLNDFHHGWLNYQIEHHLWPDLSMLSYQKAAPLMKELCKKHNVPYVQHSVWWRLKKTVDIITGDASMRKYPAKWESEKDLTQLDRKTMG
jgi:fatty acid desaturase